MAGVQIDGVNNKIDFDDDLDTSISANTDDTLVIEAGGNTMATITATTFTINDGTTITTADNTDTLTLTSTDADANSGPNLKLFRNSSSPADGDTGGVISFVSENDASEAITYSEIKSLIDDMTDGTEDGRLFFNTMVAGTLTERLRFNGTETAFNEGSADLDFRVESNSLTHMLFVDANLDKVAIGHDTPTAMLHVKDNANDAVIKIETTDADANVGPILELYRNSSSPADDDVTGAINFIGRNDNSQDVTYASIRSFAVDVSDGSEDGLIAISIPVNGTSKDFLKMGITETVFNEDSADLDFRVEGNNQTHAIFMNGELDHVNFGSSDASLYQVDIKDATDFVPGSSNTANAAPLRVRSAASTGNLGAIAIGGNNNNGIFNGANNFITLQGYEAIQFRSQQLNDDKLGTKAEVHRIEGGNFYWNRISQTLSNAGMWFSSNNQLRVTTQADDVMTLNREGDDGNIVLFRQANSTEGTISVSGSTVSYNGFTGTHWSRLADNSKPTILRGTIMESINTMMDWYQAVADVAEVNYTSDDPETKPVLCEAGHPEVEDGTANIGDVRQAAMKNVGDVKSAAMKIKESITLPEGKSVGDAVTFTHGGIEYNGTYQKEDDIKHVYSKVSDTADSTKVYGLFNSWDEDEDTVNDMIVAQVGTYVIRVHQDVTVAAGDLLVSNGDGTAKKQDDDIIRSKTVAKVNSNVKIETYSDGSYTVPCTLHC